MAGATGYDTMIIGQKGHHRIFYEKESKRRADLLFRKENGDLRIRWEVKAFIVYGNSDRNIISNFGHEKVFLMIFTDHNLNKIIEKGEYAIITLTLK